MNDNTHYPKEDGVKVEWKPLQVTIIVLSLVIIWPLFYFVSDSTKNLTNKLLLLIGLNLDIIGVVLASLKTPFYGSFYDGGKVEVIRAKVEKKYFQFGMWLIALGFILQAIGTLR